MASTFAPFRHRSYRLIWSGSLVSNIGTWMQAAALGYYTAHLTHSAGWSALVAAGEFAPTALLSPFGGVIADRLPRKSVILATSIAQVLLTIGLTIAMIAGHPGPGMLFGFALANGCAFALGFPAFGAVLPELVPEEDLSAAVGFNSASWNLGRVVGPLLGTVPFRPAQIQWVLGVNAASFLAVVFVVMIVHFGPQELTKTPVFAAIREGFHFVRTEPGLRVAALSFCLNTLFVAPFIGLIPAMVVKEFDGSQHAVGWLITAQGVGAVITGVCFGRLTARYGLRRVLVGALTFGPVALIAYAASPTWQVATVAIVAVGALYFGVMSSVFTIANLRAPTEMRGRVLSLNQVTLGAVYALSLNIEGWLGDRIGVRVVTIAGAVMSLVVLAIVRATRPGFTAILDPEPDAGQEPVVRSPELA